MKRIVLYDKVHVYKGVFNDVSSSAKFFLENNDWEKWGRWGRVSHINNVYLTTENFPTEEEWKNYKSRIATEDQHYKDKQFDKSYEEIFDIFYKVTKDYTSFNSVSLPNWAFATPSVCIYETSGPEAGEKAMDYHTDYQRELEEVPGTKFAITCNFYLNSDYDGGEVMFKIYNEEKNCYEAFKYFPEAGDVVVFPSTDPYLHAAGLVTSGEKMFIRSFWFYNFDGSHTWLENQRKYGEEVWAQMEEERAAKEASEIPTKHKRNVPTNNIKIGDSYETL
jgi:predicted 2-oxoglutarate/Fe(II)-dependent dioxygenase YbiX